MNIIINSERVNANNNGMKCGIGTLDFTPFERFTINVIITDIFTYSDSVPFFCCNLHMIDDHLVFYAEFLHQTSNGIKFNLLIVVT